MLTFLRVVGSTYVIMVAYTISCHAYGYSLVRHKFRGCPKSVQVYVALKLLWSCAWIAPVYFTGHLLISIFPSLAPKRYEKVCALCGDDFETLEESTQLCIDCRQKVVQTLNDFKSLTSENRNAKG